LGFNYQIIGALRRCLNANLPDVVRGRELNGEFEDCGEAQIRKTFLIDSLTPDLAKVWFCTDRIRPDGGPVEKFLLIGVGGVYCSPF
jgi:hypothetical protein